MLRIHRLGDGGSTDVWLRLAGEADMASSPLLADVLVEAEQGRGDVHLDVRRLRFVPRPWAAGRPQPRAGSGPAAAAPSCDIRRTAVVRTGGWVRRARGAVSVTLAVDRAKPVRDTAAHLAFFYRDGDEYLDGVRRFVQPGIDAGEPVVVAVPSVNLDALRDGLDGDASGVEFLDMEELGSNPARIIPAVHGMLERHAGRPLHYVGEPIWAGRSPEEICEATRHEALINLAWPDARIRVLCPYDATALDEAVLADAERTHPHVLEGDRERPSPAYTGPAVPAGCDAALPEPPADATALHFAGAYLAGVRDAVARHAERAGLTGERAADLVLAANEIAANSVLHGHGGGLMRIWNVNGRLICEIRDSGHIPDPLAGRRLPAPASTNGRGLWLAQHLCDLVEIRSGRAGTTVRLHASLR
jgi:anti-sigma regulatory factor (Ser/Thr protein kinase)